MKRPNESTNWSLVRVQVVIAMLWPVGWSQSTVRPSRQVHDESVEGQLNLYTQIAAKCCALLGRKAGRPSSAAATHGAAAASALGTSCGSPRVVIQN